MPAKLKLLVVTAEKKVVDAEADDVTLPGEMGYLGILPGHAALITLLRTGILFYRNGVQSEASRSMAVLPRSRTDSSPCWRVWPSGVPRSTRQRPTGTA